jgi:hypothetical protein
MKYRSYGVYLVAALAIWILAAGAGYAAETDIANAPLASASTDVVKPNVMFIIDDSGTLMIREVWPLPIRRTTPVFRAVSTVRKAAIAMACTMTRQSPTPLQ